MFKTRVFPLCVLTNDGEVDALVAGRETGKGLAKDDGCIDVKLLAHSYIPGDMAGLGDGGEKNACKAVRIANTSQERSCTLETDSVPLEGLHCFSEEAFALGGDTRDVVLFPLNGCIYVLEYLLD